MTTHNDPELIDTVATHIQWLRRSGLADDHRADNGQSADYLARLSELLVLVTGRLTKPETDEEFTERFEEIAGPILREHIADPYDRTSVVAQLLPEVLALTGRAQRPGITRQQIRRELTIADARSPRDVDAALDRVWALLADSTTPEPEELTVSDGIAYDPESCRYACVTCEQWGDEDAPEFTIQHLDGCVGATPPAPETQT